MSDLLVLALKIAFLAALWLFILFAVNVIRTWQMAKGPVEYPVIAPDAAEARA